MFADVEHAMHTHRHANAERECPADTAVRSGGVATRKGIDALIRLPPGVSLDETFTVTHELVDHGLLQSNSIGALAERLPEGSAEQSPTGSPEQALVADGGLDYQPAARVDVAPALAGLEGRPESIYIHNIERDPEYGAFTVALLRELYPSLGLDPAEVTKEEAYLFLTGGPMTTATHVDHEFNFLLVIRGRKRVFIGAIPSPEAEAALEAMHGGAYGMCEAVPRHGREFEIGPGEGIFIPPRAAHYVVNGDEACTALSIVFATRSLERQADVYRANHRLRRLGLAPRPPGASPVRDRAKASAVQATRSARRIVRSISARR